MERPGDKVSTVGTARPDDTSEVAACANGDCAPAQPRTVDPNAVDDPRDASEAAAGRAATRCDFHLTYDRAADRREFGPGVLYGPLIPDAFQPGEQAAGDWESPADGDSLLTENGWIERYASYAVQEAVPEALEWFWVDGWPWLDPHGLADNDICRLVDKLVDDLARLRAAQDASKRDGGEGSGTRTRP